VQIGNIDNRYWLLGKPGILRVLAILYEHGPQPLHKIPQHGMGVGTTYRSAREAALLGLVHLYVCGSSKCARLTESGKRVAKKIVDLLAELEELGLIPAHSAGAEEAVRAQTP
jgi:hypothetical protein